MRIRLILLMPIVLASIAFQNAKAESGLEEEERAGLEAHNEYGRVHGVPSMSLDRQLCTSATACARRLAASKRIEHCSDYPSYEIPNLGENKVWFCNRNEQFNAVNMKKAVKFWYDEVCDFNFATGKSTGGETGHFTQLVWKTSRELGVGAAVGRQDNWNCLIIVARYRPAGNIMNAVKENVPRGNFKDSYCKKSFDIKRQALLIGSPLPAVYVEPSGKTGPAEFKHQDELSNSKKKIAIVK